MTEIISSCQKISTHCRLIVYSYLDIHDVLDRITYVSRRDRRELENSMIASKSKNWECPMFEHDYHYEAVHPYSIGRFHETVKKA